MRKLKISFIILMVTLFVLPCSAALISETFNKYEIISTTDRIVLGVDAENLIAYCMTDGKIAAYSVKEDIKLFDFNPSWGRVATFYNGKAVVIDKEGFVAGIIDKKGRMLHEISGQYAYNKECANGMICLIDKAVTENVYTLLDRNGKIVMEHFFEIDGQLSDGSILVVGAGGEHNIISDKGEVVPASYVKKAQIKDAVSLNNEIYTDAQGNVYTFSGKKLFENKNYSFVSPLDKKTAVVIKQGNDNPEAYIVNFKNGKETLIKLGPLETNYIYTSGEIYEGTFFVGNMEWSVLVQADTGNVISEKVASYTSFYEDISTIKKQVDEEIKYGFMRKDGTFLDGWYDYAGNMDGGYAVAIEKHTDETKIFVVYPDGKRELLAGYGPAEKLIISEDKAVLSSKNIENMMVDNISVAKTKNGNIYIGTSSSFYVYELIENNKLRSMVISIAAVVALAVVIFIALDRHSKRKD